MKIYTILITFLLIFLFAGLLYPQTQSREDYDIGNAQRHYFEGKYEKALKTLDRVLYKGKLNEKQLEKIHLIMALCYIENNQLYLAEEEIDELYKMSPDFKLDTKIFDPKYIKIFEEIKKEVVGAVKIITVPDTADIYIDGVLKGKSPLLVYPLYSSKHRFTIVKDNYEVKSEEYRVFPAETTTVKIQLKRSELMGIINIKTKPSEAEIYIDGIYKGQTPLVVGNLIAGRYKITVSKKGYITKEGVFNIDPRKTKDIVIELERNKDHFVFSEVFPGLGQFSKGYIKHGIVFSAATFGYIYYYMKVRKDPYLSDPANRLHQEWDGYYIGNKKVSGEVWNREVKLRSIKEKNHQRRMTRAYIIGGAFYIVNLIDTIIVIRLDIRRKLREEQERFALKLNSNFDRISLSFSIKF